MYCLNYHSAKRIGMKCELRVFLLWIRTETDFPSTYVDNYNFEIEGFQSFLKEFIIIIIKIIINEEPSD